MRDRFRTGRSRSLPGASMKMGPNNRQPEHDRK
jgi:hypothetical protein